MFPFSIQCEEIALLVDCFPALVCLGCFKVHDEIADRACVSGLYRELR